MQQDILAIWEEERASADLTITDGMGAPVLPYPVEALAKALPDREAIVGDLRYAYRAVLREVARAYKDEQTRRGYEQYIARAVESGTEEVWQRFRDEAMDDDALDEAIWEEADSATPVYNYDRMRVMAENMDMWFAEVDGEPDDAIEFAGMAICATIREGITEAIDARKEVSE